VSADPANKPKQLHDEPTGLFSISDIGVVIGLPILTTLSWLVPASCWPKVCGFISGLAMAFQPDRWGERAKIIESWALGTESDEKPSARALARAAMAVEIERSLLMLRLHRPFNRWRKVTLVGAEHIDAALKKGKGVIIWDGHFALASTGTKIALARSGYGLHHLSNIYHGYSSTFFGIKALNPIWVAAEMKALAERVVVAYVNPRPALDALRAQLEENSIVSIVVRSEASHVVTTPFFDVTLALAPGAPVLAAKTGAELLPVFTVRDKSGDVVTTVEAPIDLSAYEENRPAVQAAVDTYAKRLEPWLRQYPEQWLSWGQLIQRKPRT
jgi:lauroyl/myristoyl acyltransferase